MISPKDWINDWGISGHTVDCDCMRCNDGKETFILESDIAQVQHDATKDLIRDLATAQARIKELEEQVKGMRVCRTCKLDWKPCSYCECGCDNWQPRDITGKQEGK